MAHDQFIPTGFLTLSNTGGVELMFNRSADGVYYRFNHGQDLSAEKIYEAEIEYTEEGEAFFSHIHESEKLPSGRRSRYYLSEFIRL